MRASKAETDALQVILQVTGMLRNIRSQRLPSRGTLRLLELIGKYVVELARFDYVKAATTAQEILLVASVNYEETVQMALLQRRGVLLFHQENETDHRNNYRDEVKEQRRKHTGTH